VTPARVLLTTDVIGGVWDFSIALARELVARGTHVVLLALGEPSADQRRQASQVGAGLGLLAEPLRLEWMQDSQADVVATQRLLAGLVADVRPDVVHANQFAAACAGVSAPVVLTLHSDVLSWRKWTLGVRDGEIPAEWQPYASLVCQALAEADAVVAVSDFLAGEVHSLYGTRRAIEVIPNGWPPATMPPAARGNQTLLAGRLWDAAKNIASALQAVPPGARVLLAGEPRHPETGGLAELPPGVEALGFVPRDRLDSLLRLARIYLSPARYDPFGLLPLQAALAGCALLLSDIPSYREVWGDAAEFFRPDDVHDLRRRWAALLEDDQACARLAARARQRASQRYSAAGMTERYLAVYARVAAGVAV
jgi:glycosyltransferase involved in cell wall biosynthesis